jgi:UDP-glucose 4-epimerase
MRILVTGGCGLIGHNVVAKLSKLGHDIIIVDNKTDYGIIPSDELEYIMSERMKKIPSGIRIREINIQDKYLSIVFEEFKPELVIHLASFPRQKVVNANPQLGARVMCEGLLNLLELSLKHGVEKFVYASSSMVYGDFKDHVTEDAVCSPQGQYGIMKLAGEWLVKDYSRKTSLKHTILRPSAVYGELDVEDRVISKFMIAAMRGDILKVNGATETLDFTYVQDAADGVVAATVSNNTNNKTYNITKSHSHSLLDAAKLAVKIAGSGTIEVRDRDQDFPSRGSLNIDAARRDFDFSPKVDVDEGFQRYYDWLTHSSYWQEKLL